MNHRGDRLCVCVCFFPFILDVMFVGRTSRDHTGGRSHRISHPPSFCGACLYFSRENDSAIPFLVEREVEFCVSIQSFSTCWAFLFFFFFFLVRKNPSLPGFELTSQRVRKLRGYQLSYRSELCASLFPHSLQYWYGVGMSCDTKIIGGT